MILNNRKVCRGNGKIFLELDLDQTDDVEELITCARLDDGTRIPCSLYYAKDSNCKAVLVTPIVESRCIFVSIRNRDAEIISDVLRPDQVKWASRYNYKFHKSLCGEIRDIDESDSRQRSGLAFYECIPHGEEIILHGSVICPKASRHSISIQVYSDEFDSLDCQITYAGSCETHSTSSEFIKMHEQQFSIVLPHRGHRYIFIVEDADNPLFNSFEVLDIPQMNDLISDFEAKTQNAQIDPTYPEWFADNRPTKGELNAQRLVVFEHEPTFSIIVPLFNTPLHFLKDMVESVIDQTYAKWELVLVDASPENTELAEAVNDYAKRDARIVVETVHENLGISGNTNAGIAVAKGDFISFFDHDDVLEPNLLFHYVEAINERVDTDLLYCDEDKLMPDGVYAQPFFKPDFNLDLLRNNNYICHMLTIRKSLLETLEPNTKEFDGAQDHNMTLQAIEHARHVAHVPRILYHWRLSENSTAANADSKPYASQAGIRAIQAHLDRLGIKGTVSLSRRPFTYKVQYDVPSEHPLVSIIIPTKDHIELLKACLDSIVEKSTYDNYEIVVIENNSTEDETFEFYETIQERYAATVHIEYWEHEFNFSKLMNFGAEKSNGDYLILLNNDTTVITPNWIETMLGNCARQEVGIVGVRLLYPDDTIQHAGVCISGGVAGHLGHALPRDNWGYFALLDAQQNLSAVTAACMMTKRSVFESVGGFTEDLAVAFNDIDYCLKVRDLHKLVVYTPEVEMYHYESVSRGAEDDETKQIRFLREASYMRYKWAKYYINGDPYLNKNITRHEPEVYYYRLG